MKTNLWKLSCMALAMAAIVTGCNQNNELGTPASSGEEDVLNVVATANDFVSSDATSRVSETDYTTTFEEGDAIGVFVVRDGEALISNMKMTLGADRTTWAGENGAKLYYYKDADYIAYSPYTEGLSVTSETEIVDYFTAKLEGTTGQSTLADYQAADLMTASVAAAEVTRGQNINFKFAHQMSMIEIKVPIRAYTTTGGYEYSAPLGLKVTMAEESAAGKEFSLCTFGKETITENESEVTKGIYRCIVAPSNKELNVEGEFQDGSAPVCFPATGGKELTVTPEAGTYKGFDVNYKYEGYTATRDLEVGDYYYADGSIYPGKLGNAPQSGCIGIIFSTTVNEQALTDLGYNHGYVVSIVGQDITRLYDGKGKRKWNLQAGLVNSAVTISDSFDDRDAYTKFTKLLENNIDVALDTKSFGTTTETLKYAAPQESTGWMLPTVGLIVDIFNNLTTVQKDGSDWSLDNSNAGTGKDSTNQEQKVEMINQLKELFDNIGGGFVSEKAVHGKNPNVAEWWWSSTEEDATDAYIIEFKTNGQAKILDRQKIGDNGVIRPVFAF